MSSTPPSLHAQNQGAYPPPPPPSVMAPVAPKARRRWKPWVAGFAAFFVGVGIGASGSGDTTALDKANASLAHATQQADDLTSQLEQVKTDKSELESQVAEANGRADGAVAAARVEVQKQFASKSAALARRASDLKAQGAALDRRERKVSGMEHSWAANTVPGDGVFVVGSDVKPGIYKAGPSPSGNCYYARLAGIGGDNIIDNNNSSGPVVLSIAASDGSLETSGCADFHKVG